MPIYTEESKRKILIDNGWDPEKFEVDEQTLEFKPKVSQPVTNPTPNTVSTKPTTKETGFWEGFGGEAKRNIGPTIGGIAGTAAAGAGLAALAAPPAWPLAIGALTVGGLAGGTLGGVAQEGIESAIYSPEEMVAGAALAEKQRSEAPVGTFLGGLAPSALAFGPVPIQQIGKLATSAPKLMSRLFAGSAAPALSAAEKQALINLGGGTALETGTDVGAQVATGIAERAYDQDKSKLQTIVEALTDVDLGRALLSGVVEGVGLSEPWKHTTKLTRGILAPSADIEKQSETRQKEGYAKIDERQIAADATAAGKASVNSPEQKEFDLAESKTGGVVVPFSTKAGKDDVTGLKEGEYVRTSAELKRIVAEKYPDLASKVFVKGDRKSAVLGEVVKPEDPAELSYRAGLDEATVRELVDQQEFGIPTTEMRLAQSQEEAGIAQRGQEAAGREDRRRVAAKAFADAPETIEQTLAKAAEATRLLTEKRKMAEGTLAATKRAQDAERKLAEVEALRTAETTKRQAEFEAARAEEALAKQKASEEIAKQVIPPEKLPGRLKQVEGSVPFKERIAENTLARPDIQASVAEPPVDNTARQQQATEELAKPPTDEADILQDEYDAGKLKFQEDEGDISQMNEPLTAKEEDVLQKQGIKTVRIVEGGIDMGDGKKGVGSYNPEKNEVTISADKRREDTAFHEAAHKQAENMGRFGNDEEKAIIARAHKLGEDIPERGAKKGGEEAFTELQGARARDLNRAQNSGRGTRIKEWWNDFLAARRVHKGTGDVNDMARALARRLLDDPNYFESYKAVDDIKKVVGGAAAKGGEETKTQFQEAETESPIFTTNTDKALSNPNPFGLTPGKDGAVPHNNLVAKMQKSLPAEEQQLLKDLGVDKYLTGKARVNVKEFQKWVRENQPQAKLVDYGMEGKVSEAKAEYDRMTHDWYEKLPQKIQSDVESYNNNKDYPGNQDIIAARIIRESNVKREDVDKYLALRKQVASEPRDTSPRATSYYTDISSIDTNKPMPSWTKSKSKRNVQRVDVVIPSQYEHPKYVRADGRPVTTRADMQGGQLTGGKPELWNPDNLHENLPNTLGWAMLQYLDGPNGERIAQVVEGQSQWGQKRRKLEEKQKAFKVIPVSDTHSIIEDKRDKRSAPIINSRIQEQFDVMLSEGGQTVANHPLLPKYNSLILKAAAEQARKEGATHLFIPDSGTVMLSEKHDRVKTETVTDIDAEYSKTGVRYNEPANDFGSDYKDGRYVKFQDRIYRVDKPENNGYGEKELIDTARELAPYWGTSAHYIPQQRGMVQNYDKALPDIATKMFGEGKRVSLGEHKNATGRDDLIIKNRDGQTKTDISGMLFPLDKVSLRRELGEPFSYFKTQYQDIDSPDYTKSGAPTVVKSGIDRVRELGPKGEKIAGAATKFYADHRAWRGRFITPVMDAMVQTVGPKNIGELFKWDKLKGYMFNDSEENNRVRFYMDEISDGRKAPYTLNTKEKLIFDKVKAALKATVDEKNDRAGKTGIWKTTTSDPTYFPHVMSRKVADDLINKPDSPQTKQLINQFVAYHTAKGLKPKEIKELLDILRKSYGKRDINISDQFGPIDKAAGIGLPPSWREKNLIDRISRFTDRYARRLAYHDAFQATKVEDVVKDDGFGSQRDVKFLMEDIAGIRPEAELKREALAGLVRAGMLGPLTGAKDLAASHFLGMQHADAGQWTKANASAWKNLQENIHAGKTEGVIREHIGSIELGDDGVENVIAGLHRVRDVLNEVQFRNHLERMSRGIVMGQGRFLAADNIAAARKGSLSPQQKRFMDLFAPKDWNTKLGKLNIDEIAAKFTESVQGTYDLRGLPEMAVKGTLAPFLSLSRWSIEKVNNYEKNVVQPLLQGDIKPFLMNTLGMILGGAAIEQMVEQITGRKSKAPTVAEIKQSEEPIEGLLYKAALISSLAGNVGILGDMANRAMAWYMKDNQMPAFNNVLLEGLQSGWDVATDLASVVKEGEPLDVELLMDVVLRSIQEFSQAGRLAMRMIDPETQENIERSNKFRDLKTFKNLNNEKVGEPTAGKDFNPFMKRREREFKREKDMGKATEQLGPILLDYFERYGDKPAELKKQLRALKGNSYQTMPSMERDLEQFAKYYNWLVETQGEEEALKRLNDYMEFQQVNKMKSSLVPSMK